MTTEKAESDLAPDADGITAAEAADVIREEFCAGSALDVVSVTPEAKDPTRLRIRWAVREAYRDERPDLAQFRRMLRVAMAEETARVLGMERAEEIKCPGGGIAPGKGGAG